MTPRELAEALGGAQQIGRTWRARCPAHDDHHSSLDITTGDRVPIIVVCRVCGNTDEAKKRVIGALKSLGLWEGAKADGSYVPPSRKVESEPEDWKCAMPIPDDAPPLPNSGHSMHWAYCDAEGRVLGYTERIEKPDGGKDIKPLSWWVSTKTGAKWPSPT